MADSEALFAANHDRLFRYFCRAVGQAEMARDLTQEVFLRVSRTSIPAAADGALRGWLFRIARNLALDHHRKLKSTVHVKANEIVDVALPQPETSGEKAGAFAKRVFSIRIQAKQIRGSRICEGKERLS